MRPIVVAGLIALLGVAGCASSAAAGSAARVTGFARAGFAGGTPSGPVTVRITAVESGRLAQLVSQLHSVPQSRVHCEEPLGLMYRIVFDSGSAGQSKTVVEGYECDAAVTVTVAGKATSWRRDGTCTLLRVVRQVLPGRAKATQNLDIGCGT